VASDGGCFRLSGTVRLECCHGETAIDVNLGEFACYSEGTALCPGDSGLVELHGDPEEDAESVRRACADWCEQIADCDSVVYNGRECYLTASTCVQDDWVRLSPGESDETQVYRRWMKVKATEGKGPAGTCYDESRGTLTCYVAQGDCAAQWFEPGWINPDTGCCLCKDGCESLSDECEYFDSTDFGSHRDDEICSAHHRGKYESHSSGSDSSTNSSGGHWRALAAAGDMDFDAPVADT
jgi:hypothetical protein